MAALKKLQAEKDSGEWESLSEEAQQQVSLFPSIPEQRTLPTPLLGGQFNFGRKFIGG